MKTPTICPKCHGPLLNTELSLRNGASVWKKTCTDKLNHHFTCITRPNNDDLVEIVVIKINRGGTLLKVGWYFTTRMLMVYKEIVDSDDAIKIPWVEPTIHEYDKLVEKIKTYMVFS